VLTPMMSINDITSIMQSFWLSKYDAIDLSQGRPLKRNKRDILTRRIALHLTQYILSYSNASVLFSPDRFRLESLLALRKWTQLSQICKSIAHSSLKPLSDAIENFLFGEGLCAAMVVYHFSKFFEKPSFLNHPFVIKEISELDLNKKVCFYSFDLDKSALKGHSNTLYFLQAAYRVTRAFNNKKSSEYIASPILGKFGLKLEKRIPQLKEEATEKSFFYIEELISRLKKHCLLDKAYLLGISDGLTAHALGVYLGEPLHFIDPGFGIGTAESQDELLLFLANYITEKYPYHQTFALLEFSSQPLN
jgi:hypothetical protein